MVGTIRRAGICVAIASCGTGAPEPAREPPHRESPPHEPATKPTRPQQPSARNASLTVPIPDGYSDVSSEAHGIEGAIVFLKGTPGRDATSINFVPGEHHPEKDPGNTALCSAFAQELSRRQNAQRPRGSIVEGPAGKACQIAFYVPEQRATVVSTIVQGPKDTWIMTCTTIGTEVDRACDETLRAITFR